MSKMAAMLHLEYYRVNYPVAERTQDEVDSQVLAAKCSIICSL
jgi:hypothetical protein